jgi:Raf kinase inhibitor-like YbhB/YbcL family protein
MLTLSSHSYGNNETIPMKFVSRRVVGGKNVSPEVVWSDPPVTTKSFALTIIDPHPVANNWIHWMMINIPFSGRKIVEGASRTNSLPAGARELMNTSNELGYSGPAPPKGSGVHPYILTMYALNVSSIDLPVKSTLRQFLAAIEGKVIDEGTWTGMFGQQG